jgi:hypothetical protein
MQLVDDHKLAAFQCFPVAFLWQNDGEALRRRNENMRRLSALLLSLRSLRIARPKPDRNDPFQPQAREWLPEIFLNIVGQRPQRGNVDTTNPLRRKSAFIVFSREPVDDPEKACQRFS